MDTKKSIWLMVITVYLVIFTLEGETELTEAAKIGNPEQSIAERDRAAPEVSARPHTTFAQASAPSSWGGDNDDDDGEVGTVFADYRPSDDNNFDAPRDPTSDRSIRPSYVGIPDSSDAMPGDCDGKPFDFRLKVHS